MTGARFTDLPKRQAECLEFLSAYVRAHGISPSYVEIGIALKYKSKNSIFGLLDALEFKGFIRRMPQRARSIEILRHPKRADAPDFGQIFNAALTHDTPQNLSSFKMIGIRPMTTNRKRALLGLPPIKVQENIAGNPNV